MTSSLEDFPDVCITVEPTSENGLRVTSPIMAEKPTTIRRDRVGARIGALSEDEVRRLDAALALVLGLGEETGAFTPP